MKDYKIECEKLKTELRCANREIEYLRQELERRNDRDAQFKQNFRRFLMDTLADQ